MPLLPIYDASTFIQPLSGGTTRPWAIHILDENDEPRPYVVKLFPNRLHQSQPAVANEVFGSVLATLFDISTPEIALINFSPEFVATLPPLQRAQLDRSQPGLKFGCAYVEAPHKFTTSLARRYVATYDIEIIYAFDNLILNKDRDDDKPNMLLVGREIYVIDHEISLLGAQYSETELEKGNWAYQYEDHVFHKYLRSRDSEQKSKSFETFTWYLQNLNIDELIPYYEQLTDLGFDTDHFRELYKYLKY